MTGFRKTVLLRQVHKALKGHCDIAVATNDIYALENSGFLLKHYTLLAYRTLGVKTSITILRNGGRQHHRYPGKNCPPP